MLARFKGGRGFVPDGVEDDGFSSCLIVKRVPDGLSA